MFRVSTPGTHWLRIHGQHDAGSPFYVVGGVAVSNTAIRQSRAKPPAGWCVGDWRLDEIYRGLTELWLFNDGHERSLLTRAETDSRERFRRSVIDQGTMGTGSIVVKAAVPG